MADRRAVSRTRSGAAGHLRIGISPRAPRPVSGSLLLQKPYDPEQIVRAVRQVTGSPSA
jgi:hypothetical protein